MELNLSPIAVTNQWNIEVTKILTEQANSLKSVDNLFTFQREGKEEFENLPKEESDKLIEEICNKTISAFVIKDVDKFVKDLPNKLGFNSPIDKKITAITILENSLDSVDHWRDYYNQDSTSINQQITNVIGLSFLLTVKQFVVAFAVQQNIQ